MNPEGSGARGNAPPRRPAVLTAAMLAQTLFCRAFNDGRPCTAELAAMIARMQSHAAPTQACAAPPVPLMRQRCHSLGRRVSSRAGVFACVGAMLLAATIRPEVARAQAATGTITGTVRNSVPGVLLAKAQISIAVRRLARSPMRMAGSRLRRYRSAHRLSARDRKALRTHHKASSPPSSR